MKGLMKRLLVLTGVLTLLFATVAYAAFLSSPMGTQPDVTPQLRIVGPAEPFDTDAPIKVQIAYRDFDLEPQLRCGPAGPCTGTSEQATINGYDQGHIHVYFQFVNDDPQGFDAVASDSFCIPAIVERDGFNGVVSGICPALSKKGLYRMSAEFQSNSHVSALKATNHPQDAPTSDTVLVRAR